MYESLKRLEEYIDTDLTYQKYKEGEMPVSDFDEFCVQHCQDIENVLNYIKGVQDDDRNVSSEDR